VRQELPKRYQGSREKIAALKEVVFPVELVEQIVVSRDVLGQAE
jgi:hypothetical protein